MGQNINILDKIRQLSIARVPGTLLTVYFTPVDQDGVDLAPGSSYEFTTDDPVTLSTMVDNNTDGVTDFRFRTSNDFRYCRNINPATDVASVVQDSATMVNHPQVDMGYFKELR